MADRALQLLSLSLLLLSFLSCISSFVVSAFPLPAKATLHHFALLLRACQVPSLHMLCCEKSSLLVITVHIVELTKMVYLLLSRSTHRQSTNIDCMRLSSHYLCLL